MNSPSYFELFYNVLFHPVRTFSEMAEASEPDNRQFLFALLTVLLISAVRSILSYQGTGSPFFMLAMLIVSSIWGVLSWLLIAGIVALVAYIFTGQSRIKTFLVLSAFSAAPWILTAPLSLLKIAVLPVAFLDGLFHALGALGSLAVWGWTFCLFALAIHFAYRLSASRVILLLLLPMALFVLSWYWLIGFFVNLARLF